ncbi:hypothetical protein OSB04_010318 [Centaurea solstitialis]|uniref:Lipoxygenase domain-containing protein n=1 Tax=Centaurea solstitialis TaxID=347529 RepID=A0AA38T7C3_9ASTR|nr:hypothetical protein OSB04_010318 [Centaurea solstitialis]
MVLELHAEPWLESRKTTNFYVPRDEEFSDTKAVAYGTNILYSIAQKLVPSLKENKGFSSPKDIEFLYDKCVEIIGSQNGRPTVLRRLLKDHVNSTKTIQQMETSRKADTESFSWDRDDEFCRQTLAGFNPYSIQLVTNKDWPIKSKLKEVYGPLESAITQEIVNQSIGSFMTLDEALVHKKLFMLDYHDLLLPYVSKVRALNGTTLYGSRTLMFLTSTGTLRPIAIELTRPPNNGKPQWKYVYTPHSDAWLWRLAKSHVLAHDSCHHQLVSHWWVPFLLHHNLKLTHASGSEPETNLLRTHCVTEPYIIATHRCLSKIVGAKSIKSRTLRYCDVYARYKELG